MKAQVALEYLIIVSVALIIIIPLALYANELFYGYREDTRITLAKNAVKKLGENSDWVYSQGEPAQLTIEVYIPDGIAQISLDNNTILFKVKTSSGISNVYYTTIAPLNGSVPINSGYYEISLTAYEDFLDISW